MASNSNPNYEPAKWSKKEVDTYVKLMVDEVKKGNKTTTTFNKAGWNAIKTQLEASTGRAFKMLQLRNKMNKLRMDYRRFKKLLETPGFDWNAVTRTCTAKDEGVWDRHIKANPTWSKFRRNGLAQWPELQIIFSNSFAHGDLAIGHVEDLPNEDEEIDVDVDQSLPSTSLDRRSGDSNDCETEAAPPSVSQRVDRTPCALQTIPDASRAWISTSPTPPSAPPSARSVSIDYSITQCITVLDTLTDVPKDLYMKATKRLMEDPHWREAFIACKPEKKIWLLEMLE